MKLLYAEDEKAPSDAVSEILDFYKYTVDAVYNGEDARRASCDYKKPETIVFTLELRT